MRIIYNIGIRLYVIIVHIASLWNRKARLWVRGRKNWSGKLKEGLSGNDRVIWFHCASLGEFEQGRPIMEETRKRFPGHKILLTFFSPSGYEKRKHYELADLVLYLPPDTARNARKMVRLLQPEAVFFIKYEFWYHFLRTLNVHHVPLFLVSGNFRKSQLFFRKYGRWYRRFLHFFTHLFVQNEVSESLLHSVGILHTTVAGDTRFDRVASVVQTPFSHPFLEDFSGRGKCIVAGSTWEPDEEVLSKAYHVLGPDVKWILAPHELSASHIRKLKDKFPDSVLFTEINREIPDLTRAVIVNTIGTLSFLYRFGDMAYIGGGFGKGIHNILEAATYGIPVIIGPNYQRFAEAAELIELGGAFPVHNADEMLSTVHQQLFNPVLLKTSSEVAGSYVLSKVGATTRIMNEVCKKYLANLL